jgi:SpoVK/Ycf46/Vps4 family AAA+-type ATPase
MASVKREVETLINVAKVFTIRKQRGLPVPDVSFHMVFSGNPGTGKTSVARIIAQVYGCLGLLKGGQLIEVDRSGLVGNFVGQTATKTKKVIETATGGVLFIDEAYALTNNSDDKDFGHEAIETLLKAMEDHRDELVVIVAGYTNKMDAFLASNPGLLSRFPRVISFPDYSRDELFEIFARTANQNKYFVHPRVPLLF